MRICGDAAQPVRAEIDVMKEMLPFAGAHVLELGCGAAVRTQEIAQLTDVAHIVGAEIDAIAHEKNLARDIDRVTFACFGAEAIEADDASFDIVVMLKSLHHVPGEVIGRAFSEIARVLRVGGLLYISEPVFAGDLNEVIRLFHDEEQVRGRAFQATCDAVASGGYELVQEYFYLSPVAMRSFEQFEQGVMRATHTTHHLTDDLIEKVRARFEEFKGEDQTAPYRFETPNRVDLLRKVG